MKKKIERLKKIQEQEIKKGRIDVKAVITDEIWERGHNNKPRDKKELETKNERMKEQ